MNNNDLNQNPYYHFGNTSPYYDDFDANKNYTRILFRPGLAVQSREVTQAQTILQNQLSALGSYSFKNGSTLSGAKITTSYQQYTLKLKRYDTTIENLIGKTFVGETSGEAITIINHVPDTLILLFSYVGGEITDGETFTELHSGIQFDMESGSISKAMVAACNSGIMFVDGYFINIQNSNIIVDVNPDPETEYNIGFIIHRKIITVAEDPTLADPAAGYTNANAPGANRYQVSATLTSYKTGDEDFIKALETVSSSPLDRIDFIAGIVIKNNVIIKEQNNDPNGNLIDTLAKRTYEESGSYTVNPWRVQLENYYDNDIKDISKYVVSVQPGSGYIQGYRVQNLVSKNITVEKPRSDNDIISKPHNASYFSGGTSVKIRYKDDNTLDAKFLPNINIAQEVEIMSAENGVGDTPLGKCNVVDIYKEGTNMFLYLSNDSNVRLVLQGARSLRAVGDPNSYINLQQNELSFVEVHGAETPLIIETPYSMIKEVENNSIEYEMTLIKSANSEASGNTIRIIEGDKTINFPTSLGLITIYNNTTGTHINTNEVTLIPDNSSDVSSLTITGASIENSQSYSIVMRIKRVQLGARAKVAKEKTETIIVDAGRDVATFTECDIVKLKNVKQINNKTTDESIDYDNVNIFTFNNGQNDNYYDFGSISGINSSASNSIKLNPLNATTYEVTYVYYEHSSTAGPFTSNSYLSTNNENILSDIEDLYSEIPKYRARNNTIYNLRDCLDYRVKITALSSGHNFPTPKTEIEYACYNYLPRIDSLVVDKNGTFSIIKGISSENPLPPVKSADLVYLYNIKNKAYVSDLSDIELEYNNIQRYTMNDIAAVDNRLKNLEEVVAFTQLEQNAINMQITDENGNNRYKSGIFTDNFSDFTNSDFTNEEWNATIDEIEQSTRPLFNVENFDFKINTSHSSYNSINDADVTVTLPYTTEIYAQNILSSETYNVQELLFYVWNGNVKLEPSIDNWVNDLGQIVVSETFVDTPKPPASFRSWSSTAYYENHGRWINPWGSSQVGFGSTTTTIETTDYEAGVAIQDQSKSVTVQDEFMRNRTVKYHVTGLRPGVEVKATIDDKPLTLSNNMPVLNEVNGTVGTLEGEFIIPDNVPVGTKQVKFFDANETSFASTEYTANGVSTWKEIDRTYIRTWEPVTTTSTVSQIFPWDPIAQSIYIDDDSGIFVDSFDVYFQQIDELIDVTLFIAEMENGMPTDRMVPLSRKSLSPKEIDAQIKEVNPSASIQDNELAPNYSTKFKFDNPIYLAPFQEYAFIVITPSYKYEIYTSTLGKSDIKTGIGIAEQPHLGSMFLSQNARTWTPEQLSDLTFKLHKCVFDTNVSGISNFRLNIPASEFEVAMYTLVSNVSTPTGTNIEYSYKWYNESSETNYNNYMDIFSNELKTIGTENVSLDIFLKLTTNNKNLSPIIDKEQVYGIFTNNIVNDNDNPEFVYDAGTYISKPVTLENPADDMRIVLDAILPGYSDLDVYYKSTTYQPLYVTQANNPNTICIDTANNETLIGKQLQIYYFNKLENRLEPKSYVSVSGVDILDARKIYLREVGKPEELYPIDLAVPNQEGYAGLDSKYTSIIIMPILSENNISITNWTEKTYSAGSYVFFNGNIWRATVDTNIYNTPSDFATAWEKINAIKTISKSTLEETPITWRKMKRENSLINNSIAGSQFIEYSYVPENDTLTEFNTFSIKIKFNSKNKVDVPRVKNLRAIAVI